MFKARAAFGWADEWSFGIANKRQKGYAVVTFLLVQFGLLFLFNLRYLCWASCVRLSRWVECWDCEQATKRLYGYNLPIGSVQVVILIIWHHFERREQYTLSSFQFYIWNTVVQFMKKELEYEYIRLTFYLIEDMARNYLNNILREILKILIILFEYIRFVFQIFSWASIPRVSSLLLGTSDLFLPPKSKYTLFY